MVTNDSISSMRSVNRADGASLGLVASAMMRMRRSLCALHGHDALLHFERDRMFLRCASCGHETPGWKIGATAHPPVRIREVAARSARVTRLQGARRIA